MEQAKFEGWAVIELFGHAREAGFVTTEYFGTAALFRVDVPTLPEREIILERAEWIDVETDRHLTSTLADKGSKISRSGVEGRTRYIGPSAVYAMNPCSEEAAKKALEAMTPRTVKIIELVERKRLSGLPGEDYEDDPNDAVRELDEEIR